MSAWNEIITAAAAFGAVSLAVYSLCHVLVWRVVRRPKEPYSSEDSVSVLKPLCGVDTGLNENLHPFAEQSHKNLELIFGVADARDDAMAVAQDFCNAHEELDTHLSIGEAPDTINPKVALLERMSRLAKGEWVVVSDSNVRVDNSYVAQALSHADDDVGLVTHLVSGQGGDNAAAHMENLQLNCFIAPAVCGARFLASRTCVIGKSMFLRRAALEKIGGFKAAGHYLAEDYAIGQAIEHAGLRVVTSSVPVQAWHEGWNFTRFFNRHLRWAVMRRRVSAIGYFCELLLTPAPLLSFLLVLSLTSSSFPVAPTWLAGGLALELVLANITYRVMSGQRMPINAAVLHPIREFLNVGIWVLGWFVQKIEWRGKAYRIGQGSALEPVCATVAESIADEA